MATKNVVPRASGEGKVGTATKPWSEINANSLHIGGNPVATTVSPAFSGTPTAPTAAPGTNTTQLASTAFIQAALAALTADVGGPGSSTNNNVAVFNGTGGDTLADGGATVAQIRDRSTHTGTQLMATISDAGDSATKNVGTIAGTVAAGDDSRFTDSRTPTTHASTHINGGSDPIDGDKLDISWNPTNYTPATTPAEVDSVDQLVAHLYGIDQVIGSGAAYTDEQARDAVGAAMAAGNTNSIHTNPDDAGDFISLDLQRKTAGLTANTQGSLGEDSSGVFVELGTTSNKAASGQDSRFPTADEKAALEGTDGSASASNKYVTNSDSRLTDARTPSSHGSTHSRSGSDPIDGDTIDIDWNPTHYTPATTPTEVTDVDELTAHLYGIDQALYGIEQTFNDYVLTTWSTSGTAISASNTALDADVPNYTLATPVTGDWIPFYDTGAGAMRRANFSAFAGGGGGSGPDYGSNSTVTIAAGVATITGSHHAIDTQGSAATDDLETITKVGANDGDSCLIYAANDARTVVIKHNAGNIYCWGASDVTLDENNKAVLAIWSALYSRWMILGSVGAGGGGGGTTLPVDDTTALVSDPASPTKLGRLDVGQVSAGTTRALQLQNGNARASLFTIEREIGGTSFLTTGTSYYFMICRRAMTITDLDGELNGSAGSGNVRIQIRKNASLVGTVCTMNQIETGSSTNDAWGTSTQGVACAAGDTIEIYIADDGNGGSGAGAGRAPVVASITGFYHAV